MFDLCSVSRWKWQNGRLWQTAILKEWKDVFAWIPVESLIKENQSEYYNALNSSDSSADKNGHWEIEG